MEKCFHVISDQSLFCIVAVVQSGGRWLTSSCDTREVMDSSCNDVCSGTQFKSQAWKINLEQPLKVKGLSPLWIILCFFKSPARENVLGHSLITIKEFLNHQLEKNHQLVKMPWNTDHSERVSLQYGFFYGSVNYKLEKITWDIDHKYTFSLQYGFFYVSLNYQLQKFTW